MTTQKKNGEIYVALLYELLIDEIKFRREFRRFVKCEIFEIDELELFDFINDLMKAFSEIANDSLNTHNQVKHSIDLMNDRISKSNSIYNMSQNELAIIRKYLENAQRKK